MAMVDGEKNGNGIFNYPGLEKRSKKTVGYHAGVARQNPKTTTHTLSYARVHSYFTPTHTHRRGVRVCRASRRSRSGAQREIRR